MYIGATGSAKRLMTKLAFVQSSLENRSLFRRSAGFFGSLRMFPVQKCCGNSWPKFKQGQNTWRVRDDYLNHDLMKFGIAKRLLDCNRVTSINLEHWCQLPSNVKIQHYTNSIRKVGIFFIALAASELESRNLSECFWSSTTFVESFLLFRKNKRDSSRNFLLT